MAYGELALVLMRRNDPYAIVVSLAYFFPTKLHERPCGPGNKGHDETTNKCKSVVEKQEIFGLSFQLSFQLILKSTNVQRYIQL
jgi:hypothetical protein